jgi:hypothetical protein
MRKFLNKNKYRVLAGFLRKGPVNTAANETEMQTNNLKLSVLFWESGI